MEIVENMQWPPRGPVEWKMAEHSAWYTGDPLILSNFYSKYASENPMNLERTMRIDSFWSRQISNQNDIYTHVPVAGDIAETSANFLFGESPSIKVNEASKKETMNQYKETQKRLDDMLMESGFYRKIIEGAEACAALGGIYYKIAWDEELSPYPIPVFVQADRAIPEFSFGILKAVTFWSVVEIDKSGNTVYRLLERYQKGAIVTSLYKGTVDRLGTKVALTDLESTKDIEETVTTVDELLAGYIPNKLPNRLDRSSPLGRSDYAGIEMLMDNLDETFSSWMTDIAIGQGKIHVPESFLTTNEGKFRYNIDKKVYVRLEMDPTIDGKTITATQFSIRAAEFEKTTLNLLDRIFSLAGYSPQSFGLNIEGRAESGTALGIRERKSMATKSKKENYWQMALKRIVKLMSIVYVKELGSKEGSMDPNFTPNISFNDSLANNLTELSTSVKMISDAQAASTETKVRLLHPDWDEDQIKAEVAAILEETSAPSLENPDLFEIPNRDEDDDQADDKPEGDDEQ